MKVRKKVLELFKICRELVLLMFVLDLSVLLAFLFFYGILSLADCNNFILGNYCFNQDLFCQRECSRYNLNYSGNISAFGDCDCWSAYIDLKGFYYTKK